MRKSSFHTDLKGPPPVREWYLMDHTKDGSPCVIKRRFGYWQTNIERLTEAEKKLAEYKTRPRAEQLEIDAQALRERIDNKLQWLAFSEATLRNSIRFARARITTDSDDYTFLMRICPTCGVDTSTLGIESPFARGLQADGKSNVCCVSCCDSEMFVSAVKGVSRRGMGRMNKSVHEDLRYYDRVLDQFFLAKKAVAGNSLSDSAFLELQDLTAKTIGHFKNQSAREGEDAEQAGALGLMEAARKFDPDPEVSKRAKFTTYASLWIRRRAQARKTSHCKPGTAIIKGKHVATAQIDVGDDDEGRSDRFHPGGSSPKLGLKFDVAEALAALPEQTRDLVTDYLIYKRTLVEIEAETGISVNKIRTIIAAGKAQLAILLADHKPVR